MAINKNELHQTIPGKCKECKLKFLDIIAGQGNLITVNPRVYLISLQNSVSLKYYQIKII